MTDIEALLWIVGATFLASGFVKGTVGMGMPTVSIGLLTLAMPPSKAAALIFFPVLATNLWQFFAGPALKSVLRRMWLMMACTALGTWLSIGVMTGGDTRLAVFVLGLVLMFSSGLALASERIAAVRFAVPPRLEPLLSPVVGLASGLVTGITGAFIFPAVPYMAALRIGKDELVQALGFSAIVSSLALGSALWARGAFGLSLAGVSVLALIPAFAGMFAGQMLRDRISEATFRRIFHAGLVLLGAWLAYRNVS